MVRSRRYSSKRFWERSRSVQFGHGFSPLLPELGTRSDNRMCPRLAITDAAALSALVSDTSTVGSAGLRRFAARPMHYVWNHRAGQRSGQVSDICPAGSLVG